MELGVAGEGEALARVGVVIVGADAMDMEGLLAVEEMPEKAPDPQPKDSRAFLTGTPSPLDAPEPETLEAALPSLSRRVIGGGVGMCTVVIDTPLPSPVPLPVPLPLPLPLPLLLLLL